MGAVRFDIPGLTSMKNLGLEVWAPQGDPVDLSFSFWGRTRVWLDYYSSSIGLNRWATGSFYNQSGLYGPDIDNIAPQTGPELNGPVSGTWQGLYIANGAQYVPLWARAGSPSSYWWNDPLDLADFMWGEATINGKKAFVATWKDVMMDDATIWTANPYEGPEQSFVSVLRLDPTSSPSEPYESWHNERNTFQIVMYEDDSFEFNYDHLRIGSTWTSYINYGIWNGTIWVYGANPGDPLYGWPGVDPVNTSYMDAWIGMRCGYRINYPDVEEGSQEDFDTHFYYELPGSHEIDWAGDAWFNDGRTSHVGNPRAWQNDVGWYFWSANQQTILDGNSLAAINSSLNSRVKGRYLFFGKESSGITPHRMTQRDDGYGIQDKSSRLPSQASSGASKQAGIRIGLNNNYQ